MLSPSIFAQNKKVKMIFLNAGDNMNYSFYLKVVIVKSC